MKFLVDEEKDTRYKNYDYLPTNVPTGVPINLSNTSHVRKWFALPQHTPAKSYCLCTIPSTCFVLNCYDKTLPSQNHFPRTDMKLIHCQCYRPCCLLV